jgi:hypothetical protein
MYAYIFKTTQRSLMLFLTDTVIQEEGFNAFNIHDLEEKHFSISITPVRSRGGSLNIIFLKNYSIVNYLWLIGYGIYLKS